MPKNAPWQPPPPRLNRRLLLIGAAGLAASISGGWLLTAPAEPATPETRQVTTYYRYCSDARAAGVAPLNRGDPGYRPELDADDDGIACEPYSGRNTRRFRW